MSLSCEVCYEFYADSPPERWPRALPMCGHDFCTRCIAALCKTEKRPTCPKCRTPFFPDEERRPTLSSDAQQPRNSSGDNNDAAAAATTADPIAEQAAQLATAAQIGRIDNEQLLPLQQRQQSSSPSSGCSSAKATDDSMVGHRYLEWPVLRCLLQLHERMDFGVLSQNNSSSELPPSSCMNLIHRALQAAPTPILQFELDQRKRRELLDQLPVEALQEELENRRATAASKTHQHQQQQKQCQPQSSNFFPPSPQLSCLGNLSCTSSNHDVTGACSLDLPLSCKDCEILHRSRYCQRRQPVTVQPRSMAPTLCSAPIYQHPSLHHNSPTNCCGQSQCQRYFSTNSQQRMLTLSASHDQQQLSGPTNQFLPHCPFPTNFCQSDFIHHPTDHHHPMLISYSIGSSPTTIRCPQSHPQQQPSHHCCHHTEVHQHNSRRQCTAAAAIFINHLITVCLFLWQIFLRFLRVSGSTISRIVTGIFSRFTNIQREQRLQLIMIANSIPLLIGSFYVFHNPTFFVQLRASSGNSSIK